MSADAIVRRYYELVDKGDLELLDLFSVDATYKRPGYREFHGRDELRRFYSADRVIESGAHTIRALYVDGMRVGVEGTFSGLLRDGTNVTLPFSDFFDLDGEDPLTIRHRRTYFDDQQV
ncbi:nuclear transport factor 2 family protein [Gordonia sp. DT30]|uniref:nuclear transport factor 2 family protein n=1 Tax=unclassified Gordonia (in: high G+C Gram-positive bacteria) TaxID=2657482 RepID=UPI003CE9EF41